MRMIKFLLDVPFTAEEVARAVVRLKGRKALGVSFIRPLSSLWSARKYEWIVRHRLVRLVMKLVVAQFCRERTMKLSMKAQSVSGHKTQCSFTPLPARYEPVAT